MAAYAMWQLSCDYADLSLSGKNCSISLDDTTSANASGARLAGKREGWARVSVKGYFFDLCPSCKDEWELRKLEKNEEGK